MKKRDIRSISDIYRMISENADMSDSFTEEGGNLYIHGPEKLRLNKFDKDGKPLVVFFTKHPGSETENDKLHNADETLYGGAAVVFFDQQGQPDPDGTYYFIEGKLVSKDSDEYRSAAADVSYKNTLSQDLDKSEEDIGFQDLDVFD